MSDSSTDDRLRTLVAGLLKKTQTTDPWDKPLPWEPVGPDGYDLNLSATTISIFSSDGDGNFPFVFRILDQNGRAVEEVTEFANDQKYGLGPLYNAISRMHSGIDKKLTEIMNELGIRDTTGEPPF